MQSTLRYARTKGKIGKLSAKSTSRIDVDLRPFRSKPSRHERDIEMMSIRSPSFTAKRFYDHLIASRQPIGEIRGHRIELVPEQRGILTWNVGIEMSSFSFLFFRGRFQNWSTQPPSVYFLFLHDRIARGSLAAGQSLPRLLRRAEEGARARARPGPGWRIGGDTFVSVMSSWCHVGWVFPHGKVGGWLEDSHKRFLIFRLATPTFVVCQSLFTSFHLTERHSYRR